MDNLVQGSESWLQMRKNKIGASDAPPIMGVSPYKSAYRLWEEKLDLSPPNIQTPAMRRGLQLEDRAREELEKITGMLFLPQVRFHSDISWMMASLDGIDPTNRHIVEIKCPNKDDHQCACSGNIPEKYFPQMQHQMEVCALEMGYYFSFDGSNGVLVKVYRDDGYIKKMLQKEKDFWNCLQDFVAPALSCDDYCQKTDIEWVQKAQEWLLIDQQLKSLAKSEKDAREYLIALSKGSNSIGAGVRVNRIVRKGNVDYASIPEIASVDLDKYRKNPTEYYKISASN